MHRAQVWAVPDSYEHYLEEIQQYAPLSREQEGDAARAARAGDQSALDRLIRANLRFVVKVAREYSGRGVPLLDLIAEGNMGLVEAARRFDERRGCKFITYAVWWIRNRIHQELRRGACVVPLSWKQVEDRKRVRREVRPHSRSWPLFATTWKGSACRPDRRPLLQPDPIPKPSSITPLDSPAAGGHRCARWRPFPPPKAVLQAAIPPGGHKT